MERTKTTEADELTGLSIAATGKAMRDGVISALELTQAYLDRIDRLNPELCAYITVAGDQALNDARRLDKELRAGTDRGPLHGIPIAVKDVIDTAGITTTGGARVYSERVPAKDAAVVAQLREAGAIVLGKANTHELAANVTTSNPHYGIARNPWDRDRIPGGSSGGSAVAVAAHLAAGAIGNDTGGSVRIPASMCGVVGLKPTFGLVSRSGELVTSSGDHVGPLARTVEDAAILLQAMVGYDPADPATLPIPVPDYRATLNAGLNGVRVGVPRAAAWTLVTQEVRAVCEPVLDVLRNLGASIVEVTLPDAGPSVGVPGGGGLFSFMIEEMRWAHRRAWQERPDDFGPDLVAVFQTPALNGTQYAETLEWMWDYAAAVRTTLAEVDILVSPTIPLVAPPIGTESVTIEDTEMPLVMAAIANTAPYNVSRTPAISVPCGTTEAGLPVGLQIAGPPLGEPAVLQAAHAYQQATGSTTDTACCC